MKLKKMGISLRVETIEKYDERRDTISHDWINFLQKLNFIPILIPNNLEDIEGYISELKLDGIILSGGDNLGEFPERDETESKMLEIATKNSIPVLGICRGMQIINNFFGGNLHKRDDPEHINNNHTINLTKHSPFNENNSITVNSYHNNVIESKDLGKDLKSFATHKDDNTVEGFIHVKYPIIGIMWHPERNPNDNSIQLFKEIFSVNKQ